MDLGKEVISQSLLAVYCQYAVSSETDYPLDGKVEEGTIEDTLGHELIGFELEVVRSDLRSSTLDRPTHGVKNLLAPLSRLTSKPETGNSNSEVATLAYGGYRISQNP